MGQMEDYDKTGPVGPEQERAELEAVLDSAVFRRAPNQSRLLRYLCERSLTNQAEPPKEHQIALEALGRSNDFDQRENSIVRVEAYRVRKKLQQYYQTEGRSHRLRITIDPGQYIPKFLWTGDERAPGEPHAVALRIQDDRLALPGSLIEKPRSGFRLAAGIIAIAILVALGVFFSRKLPRHAMPAASPAADNAAREPAAAWNSGDEVRILAGYPRSMQIDRLGHVWSGDRYFSGGQTVETPRRVIARTPDQTLFGYCRFGDFSYNIPLKPGVYELRLYFAQSVEPWTLSDQPAGSFAVLVAINGKTEQYKLNFAADGAASSTADVRVFKNISPAGDGQLHLHFAAGLEFSFVNAIEVAPGIRNRLKPIRISARDSFYTDRLGHVWPPDRYFRGGTTVERRDPVSGTDDPDLFSFERYGNFDYLIPLAQGAYTVTLGLAETWFGPKYPGGGGPSDRIFDVSANGMPLVKNLDVYREAGGSGKVLFKTFHGVHPDADGKLRLAFAASRNNAMVNTIQIEDESK